MSDALRDAIEDAVWNEVADYVSVARALRVVDAVLAITEADKAEAVAHERRRVVAEAHRALVSPWTGDPGAGPRYVMATCLRDFDRLMEMLPATQPSREAWRHRATASDALKAFVRDLATHGIRFDLNPTLDSRDPLATDRYVGRIDADIRKRAIQALSLAAEAGITVDAHTEES